MNYVSLTGGLGNQMFIYAFKVSLSTKHKTVLFHPFKKHSRKYGHEGFQLEDIFHLEKETIGTRIALFFLSTYWIFIRFFPKATRVILLKLIGIKEFHVPHNFVYYDGIINKEYNHILFRGTWQSEKYFSQVAEDLRKTYTFRENLLNYQTKNSLEIIRQLKESVSIHIRRGDYLSPTYANGFGGICTKDYYHHAIELINSRVDNPSFFVFSDDLDWCRNNIIIENAVYVDWNTGEDSWQDMFLMSKCKHNIIANSSFSWWGAWLNSSPDKIVIAPRVWWNGIIDDVVPENWIRI